MKSSRMRAKVIEVSNLVKRYGDRLAVDGVSFSVEEGEILAILGPNMGQASPRTCATASDIWPHPTTNSVDRSIIRSVDPL